MIGSSASLPIDNGVVGPARVASKVVVTSSRPARPPVDEPVPELSRRRLYLLFAGLMVGLLLAELDQNIFATALPTIVGELGGVNHMLWVTTPYVVAGTVTMPIYGKLSDQVGRSSLFLIALGIFLIGSVVGGLAPTMGWLIVARTVQGLGGGGLLILVQAIVADVIPARERARYLSYVSAMFALAAVLGPLVGGWLTEGPGWRWAFWINLPLGGAAMATAVLFLRRPAREPARLSIDVWGITTMTVGVTALVLITSWGGTQFAWSSPVIGGLGLLALVSSVAFVLVERAVAEPIIPLHLFAERNFTVPTLAGLVTAVAMFGAVNYLPTYLQMVTGLSPVLSGLLLLALIAGLGLATVGSAQVVSRTGRYKELPITGCTLVAVALGLLSTLAVDSSLWLIGSYLLLLGLGIGCVLQILVVIVQNTAASAEVGTATAANNFFREIGVSLGTALVGTLFTFRLQAQLSERVTGGLDLNRLTPAGLEQLPEAVRESVVLSYHEALTPVFLALVPLMVLSALGLAFVRPVPLATTTAGRSPE